MYTAKQRRRVVRTTCACTAITFMSGGAAAQWEQAAKLTQADGATLYVFGTSVCISGDTAVIGASGDDDAGEFSGSAYIFRDVDGIWVQISKLTAGDAAPEDRFGFSVSISGDTTVIGAYSDNDAGLNSGSAYVFRDIGGVWQQIAKLIASDAAATDEFGTSVSISGDTAVVGARFDDDSGSAYVFRDVGGVWQQIAKLTSDDAAVGDRFGTSVSISDDTAVIGAHGDDDAGEVSGSAYLFREVDGVWQQIAKLTADDGAAADFFGFSVSISGDMVVVGALGDDDAGPTSGSAYVFRDVSGAWQQIAKLVAADGDSGDEFGASVSINEDTAVIGALEDSDAGRWSGSASVFALRCHADIDGDGDIDAEDFFAYLDLFGAGCP